MFAPKVFVYWDQGGGGGRVSKVDENAPAGSSPASALNQKPALLESDVSLSNSLIWRKQREFYVQRGLKAWTEDLVPNFITNNPFIAEIYARVVFGFLSDCMEAGPSSLAESKSRRVASDGADACGGHRLKHRALLHDRLFGKLDSGMAYKSLPGRVCRVWHVGV